MQKRKLIFLCEYEIRFLKRKSAVSKEEKEKFKVDFWGVH